MRKVREILPEDREIDSKVDKIKIVMLTNLLKIFFTFSLLFVFTFSIYSQNEYPEKIEDYIGDTAILENLKNIPEEKRDEYLKLYFRYSDKYEYLIRNGKDYLIPQIFNAPNDGYMSNYTYSQIDQWINYTNGDLILALAEEGNYMWVGTTGGLIQIDKATGIPTFYNSGNSGLPGNLVYSIEIDGSGNKWIGTGWGGLALFDGENWTIYNTSNSSLPVNRVYSIAIDGSGNKWISTWGGLARFDGDNWTVYNTSNSGLPSNYVNSIAIDESGNKWIGTGRGLALFDGENWTVYNPSNSGLPYNWVNSIEIDGSGNKWIGTGWGGLALFDGENWTIYNTSNSSLPVNRVYSIAIDGSGNKWIGTWGGGLANFDGENWTIYDTSNSGLPGNSVRSIAIDGSGNKWIGTGGGLARYDGDNWTVYNTSNSGLPAHWVNSIAIDGNGNKWIGTRGGGLAHFDGDNWTVYNTSNSGLPNNYINSIATYGIVNKWIGTGDGLAHFDCDDWTVYNTPNSGLPGNSVNSIAIDGSGNKWIGTSGGLTHFNGETWNVYNTSNSGLPENWVYSIAIDGNGYKWIGAEGGLAIFDGDNWTVYTMTNSGLPSNVVYSIAIDGSGNKWIGTGGGLAFFDGDNWIVYNALNSGLPSNVVYSIAIDGSGNKWIGTGGGLAVYMEVYDDNYEIYGTVTKDGVGLGNVIITASGDHEQTVMTDDNGAYIITDIPHGSYVTVTPSKEGYSFKPPSITIENISQDTTGIDFIVKYLHIVNPISSTAWRAGSAQKIKWHSEGVDIILMEYSIDNGSTWEFIPYWVSASIGSYEWTVPVSPSTECRLRIWDGSDSSVEAISNNFTIYSSNFNISYNRTFADPTATISARMIGFPGNIDIPLSSILKGEQNKDWKAAWDNGRLTNYLVEYDGSSRFNLKPGRGFWIISKNRISVHQVEETVNTQDGQTYAIPLHYGWNIISNPFNKSVQWEAVQIVNNIQTDPLWSFTGSYRQSAIFEPYVGYYFYNRNNLNSLKIPYNDGAYLSKQSEKSIVSVKKLTIGIVYNTELLSMVEIIHLPEEHEDVSLYNQFAPPGNYLDVQMLLRQQNIEGRNGELLREVRIESGDGEMYHLQVRSNENQYVSFSIDGLDEFIGSEVYLVDRRTGRFYDLHQMQGINIPVEKGENEFSVLIGDDSYIDEKREELLPQVFTLYQNYPNPFNSMTTIEYAAPATENEVNVVLEVYNILGQQVSVLVNESHEAGLYRVTFNGNNLPSGMYIYRFRAGDFIESKRFILLK